MREAAVPRPLPAPGAVLAWLGDRGVYVALALLVAFNMVFTANFVTVGNLRLQLVQVVPVALVAVGMALVIGTEGIDLSVGSTMAIAAALLPLYLGYGPWVAIPIALAAGGAVGLLNGGLVALVGVQPIVATLGVLVGGRGIALMITGGALVELFVPFFKDVRLGKFLGIPYVMIVAALLAVLVSFLVRRTAFGYRLLAIGGNRRASLLAGLPVRRTLIVVYTISGTLAAVAGVIATARLRASDPSYIGLLMELSAITAVVVGGTSLTGGRVRILGTVAGAILLQLLETTLVSHNAPDSVARMVEAVIIIAAVYIQRPARSSR
jgi:ribose/xylose/arabinose/galactoside ABC-type transport system permease subunit